MECYDARRLIDAGMSPGSSDSQRAALGFHLAGCVACRGYRARAENAQLLQALLAPPVVAPPVVMRARFSRRNHALRAASAALLIGGALALLPTASVAPAVAAPTQRQTVSATARRATWRPMARRDAALLKALLERPFGSADARAARLARARQSDAALLEALLERPVSAAEARAARAAATALANAPLAAGQALTLPALADSGAPQAQQGPYTVQPGDSLWTIAAKYYGNGAFWTVIYNANTKVVGGDPNMIFPAQSLTIPAAPATPPAAAIVGTAQANTITTQTTTQAAAKVAPGSNYTIVGGDTLSGIAFSAYTNAGMWQDIYNANKAAIGGNPDLIFPGTVLKIPATTTPPAPAGNPGAKPGTSYTIVSGDTLTGIAFTAYGNASRWQDIYNANKAAIGSNPNLIFAGTVLKIP